MNLDLVNEFFGFEKLDKFIRRTVGLEINAENILIKYNGMLPNLPISNNLTVAQILEFSLEQHENGNILCQGYLKNQKQWSSINTTRNILRSKTWASIFKTIGDEYSLFILKNTCIIQKIGENMILLCGELGNIVEKKKDKKCISKDKIFRGKPSSLFVSVENAIKDTFENIEVSDINFNIMAEKIKKTIEKYQKVSTRAIFKSFILENRVNSVKNEIKDNIKNKNNSNEINENKVNIAKNEIKDNIKNDNINNDDSIFNHAVQPEKIANFLFLISKKFLRPIFNIKSFKVLKGKITLFLKRNAYETLNFDDLTNYFSTSNFKLFSGCKSLSHPSKIAILKNFMAFLFDSIFLNILRYFFYSTTASFSKLKIHYFCRINWNNKTGKFFQEYLKEFQPCEKTCSFATLRCIPKESGFRVISNCSRLTSKNTYNKMNKKKDFVKSKKLSVNKLLDRYEDIDEILKNNGINKTVIKNNRNEVYKFNSINSKVSILVPILKNIAKNISGFSLLHHFYVDQKIFPFLRSKNKRMIMVKIDLLKCFDNIPHDNLLKIIEDLLENDEYYFREFEVLRENIIEDKYETKFLKYSPEMLYPMNMPVAQPHNLKTANLKSGIPYILKENRSKIITKNEIFKKIADIVKNAIVVYQNKYYTSTKGIPQGCCISSLLCSIYFAILDREFPDLDWIITRFIDDFLIITENPENIIKFFKIADKLKDKGLIINHKKLESNCNLEMLAKSCDLNKSFISNSVEWCGMRVYDEGIAIKSICKDPYFRFNVSISSLNRGKRIFNKIKKSLNIKLSKLYINGSNKKLGECIFDSLFFCVRRLKILILRTVFININFVSLILKWCKDEIYETLRSRNIRFDDEKIEKISTKVFEKCNIKNIKKKKFK